MIVLLAACAPSLVETHVWDDGVARDTSDTAAPFSRVETTALPEGWVSVVDARDGEDWVAFDLDSGEEVELAGTAWDLRFQRFHMSVNGGISGDGGVEAIFVPALALEDAESAPDGVWVTDTSDGPDDDDHPEYALTGWYAYDEATHILTPKPGVWFVRTTDRATYALAIDTYYNAVGSSAVPSFRWRGPVADSRSQ